MTFSSGDLAITTTTTPSTIPRPVTIRNPATPGPLQLQYGTADDLATPDPDIDSSLNLATPDSREPDNYDEATPDIDYR